MVWLRGVEATLDKAKGTVRNFCSQKGEEPTEMGGEQRRQPPEEWRGAGGGRKDSMRKVAVWFWKLLSGRSAEKG